jgi:hypothetical protein
LSFHGRENIILRELRLIGAESDFVVDQINVDNVQQLGFAWRYDAAVGQHCGECHSLSDEPGGHPNLVRLAPGKHAIFDEIVLRGALASGGMANFSSEITYAASTERQPDVAGVGSASN